MTTAPNPSALDIALSDLAMSIAFLDRTRSPDHPLVRSQLENLRRAYEELAGLRRPADVEAAAIEMYTQCPQAFTHSEEPFGTVAEWYREVAADMLRAAGVSVV